MGIRCADHVTPLYPQKLALTSPTSGGRSVGIVPLRTKVTEFSDLGEIRHKNLYLIFFGICDFLENWCSEKGIFLMAVNNIVFSREH